MASNVDNNIIDLENNSFPPPDDNEDNYFPSNQINNNSLPSSSSRSNKKTLSKKKGRQFSYVWNYFKIGDVSGHGHYKATCNFCERVWTRGKPKRMAAHLSNNCPQVPHDIRNTILNAFLKEYGSSPLDESSDDDYYNNNNGNQITKKTRLATNNSTLHNFYDRINLPLGRKKEIDRSLLRAFVMCDISFSAIKNPYFFELLKQLNGGYQLPSFEVLSGNLLDIEVASINLKIENLLAKSKNITLSKCHIYIILFCFLLP